MAESDLHVQLVERITRSLAEECPGEYLLFVDGRNHPGVRLPPMIDAVRPDVFGRHSITRKAVIGEAKTLCDIATPHTELQLTTYFRFLAAEGGGTVQLAVPWKGLDQMFYMAKRTQRLAAAQHVNFVVSGWALPDADFCLVRRHE